MGNKTRPTGVGRFNANLNQLLLDPNFDALFPGSNLFTVESADINLSDVLTFQVLLVEATTSTFSWWTYEYDVDTGIWTNQDSDATISLAGMKEKIASMPINSMNVAISDTEVATIKTMLGII